MYAYAGQNPLAFIDPLGLFCLGDVLNLVPVLGSALDAYDSFSRGDIGLGLLNVGLAALDLTGIGAVAKGVFVGGFKLSQKKALDRIYAPNKNGKLKSPKFENIRKRMKRVGLVDDRDVHHWWHKQADQRAGKISHEKLNKRWNLMPNMSEEAHYLAHHGTPSQKFWYGTPHWAKAAGIGALSYSSGLLINGCQCK